MVLRHGVGGNTLAHETRVALFSANRMMDVEELKEVFVQVLRPWAASHGLELIWLGTDHRVDFVGVDVANETIVVSFSTERFAGDISVTFYKGPLSPPMKTHERLAFLFETPQIHLSELAKGHRLSSTYWRHWLCGRIRTREEAVRALQVTLALVDQCAGDVLRGDFVGIKWHSPASS